MRFRRFAFIICVALGFAGTASAQDQPPPADPLTVKIDMTDVERFIALWKKTGGRPSAAQIDAEYIKGGGTGLKLFVPLRDLTGTTMAEAIGENRDWYDDAINKCLPWVQDSTADLRSICLGLHGLLPERPLPQIYMLFGRANTGGTAAPGAQLLGLEILCWQADTPQKFRTLLRMFFAHETAHTFQLIDDTPARLAEPLLTDIMQEGVADYVASFVTGEEPDQARAVYGRAHEREMWTQFLADRSSAMKGFDPAKGYGPAGKEARRHWLYNGRRGRLDGWGIDMGYWLGMQIARAYVERAADRHAAVRELLALPDPGEILRKSGYADKFSSPAS